MSSSVRCWIDGQFVEEARLPATDRGLLWGEGLFETLRVAGGRPFRLTAHLARLRDSVAALGLPSPGGDWTVAVAGALDRLARGLPGGSGRARLTLTAGDAEAGGDPAVPPAGPARLILTVAPYGGPPPRQLREGATAAPPPGESGAGAPGMPGHKTLAYLPQLRILRAARAAGFDEGLCSAARGRILGGSRSNLFLVHRGRLLTPALGTGCLPGITRAVVLGEIAPALGLEVEEAQVPASDLEQASEAFLTNSLWGVLPLGRIGARRLPAPAPGSVTHSVACSYESILARECGRL